jgi:hypothetical protein
MAAGWRACRAKLMTKPDFPPGSVGHTMSMLNGVWHDVVETFYPDGRPLSDDTNAGSGTPGASPFENLVYVDFDGHNFRLTNIHIKGRPPLAKTFAGAMHDGVLVFDPLGPGSFENVGVSGGVGVLTFNARTLGPACEIYMEPDFIYLPEPTKRVRHTVLYRDGIITRTLTAHGTKIAESAATRHPLDPRGPDGPVHGEPFISPIWSQLV